MVAFLRTIFLVSIVGLFTQCHGLTVVEKKHEDVNRRLENLAAFFENSRHSISKTCHEITWNPEWNKGGEYLFILDEEGTCLAFSNQTELIYKSFKSINDTTGNSILSMLFKQDAVKNLALSVNNATMRVFFTIKEKFGKRYAICCGFYPNDLEYLTIDLSNRVIDLITRESMDRALIKLNDPYGEYRSGDISMFIIDDNGIILAQPDNYALLGKNNFDPNFHSKEEIETFKKILESRDGTGWVVTQFRNALNRMFCQRYIDPKNKKRYLICTFYYPDISDDDIYSLVQRAIANIQTAGLKKAIADFNYASKKPDYAFAKGTGSVSVYSLDGTCLAHGEDPTFVGETVLNRQDRLGRYPIKDLLEQMKRTNRAWYSQYSLGAYKQMYAEKVNVAEGSVIVVSGYWLHTKYQLAKDMVQRAADLMKRTTYEHSLEQFLETDSDFLRGDISISMYDLEGFSRIEGPFKKTSVWKKLPTKDEHGQSILNQIISVAANGGGWLSYKQNNAQYNVYIKQADTINENGASQSFILLSGYYV